MKKYKLSIIVTIYNLEKQLERCLESLDNQSLDDIEILCVNDGSTDNSQQIIDKFVKKSPHKFKSFIKGNGGGDWEARNYGMKRVSSEYFVFVDGDDYVYPDYALKLYNAIHNNNADMAVCAFERVDVATGKVKSIDMNKYGNKTINLPQQLEDVLLINPGPCNKVYRLKKVQNNEFQVIRGFSDLIFMLDSLPNLSKIVLIPDVLYSYQMRYDSQIHNIKEQDISAFKNQFLRIKSNYQKNSTREYCEILAVMAFIHLGISLIYRLSYNKTKNSKKNSRDILHFLNEEFKEWQHSKYLSMSFCLRKGSKFVSLWITKVVYKLHLSSVFISVYKFTVDKLKIDIKW